MESSLVEFSVNIIRRAEQHSLPSHLCDGEELFIKCILGMYASMLKFSLIFRLKVMSFTRIWIHVVFATKNREPLLNKDIRYQIKRRIIQNCKQNNIYLQSINGYTDHLHCLISLGREQTISNVVQQIKGNSAYWLNQTHFLHKEFMWQDDYFAISVSESQVSRVINYIKNQEQHHSKYSFDDEIKDINKKFKMKLKDLFPVD